jgi:hypothetical protein
MPHDKIARNRRYFSRRHAFVPEEGVAIACSGRRRASSFGRTLLAPLAGLSSATSCLASLALILAGFFARRAYPIRPLVLIAVILFHRDRAVGV